MSSLLLLSDRRAHGRNSYIPHPLLPTSRENTYHCSFIPSHYISTTYFKKSFYFIILFIWKHNNDDDDNNTNHGENNIIAEFEYKLTKDYIKNNNNNNNTTN